MRCAAGRICPPPFHFGAALQGEENSTAGGYISFAENRTDVIVHDTFDGRNVTFRHDLCYSKKWFG